eukprot:jgi/Ulvmu1/339/UM001_0343.1
MRQDEDDGAPSIPSERCHAAAAEYACCIVDDYFGAIPKAVCQCLFQHGPLPLRDIRMRSGLPRSAISKALMVLVQHGHVKALLQEQLGQERAIQTTHVYKVAPSHIFAAVRYPAFLVHVADTIGALAEQVCEQLVFHGSLTFESLLHNLVAQVPEVEAADFAAKCASAVVALMQERLVEQAPPCDLPLFNATNKSTRKKAKTKLSTEQKKLEKAQQLTQTQYGKLRYNFPADVLTAAAGGITIAGEDDVMAAEFVLLRLNCEAFEVHFRHDATVEWITAGFGHANARVARAMLDLTRPAELSNLGQDPADVTSVPLERILARVNASVAAEGAADADGDVEMKEEEGKEERAGGGGRMSVAEVETSITGLEGSAVVQMDDERAGSYYIDPATAQFMLKNNALAGYLKQRFRPAGHRVFRLLLEHKYLQIDHIEKVAMLSTRDVRTVLHALFKHGFVSVQEIPKTAEHAPSKMIFLYHADMTHAFSQVLHDTYKAAGNLLKRAAHDTRQNRAALQLAHRHLAGENVKLTKAQIDAAKGWQNRIRALHAALLSLDGMLRIFMLGEDFD